MPRVMISDSTTIVVADDLLVNDFGDELVILNLRDGVYYGLEDVGMRIWTLLQEPIAVRALRDALLSEYDVQAEVLDRDVRRLLIDLVSRGLVEIRDEAPLKDDAGR